MTLSLSNIKTNYQAVDFDPFAEGEILVTALTTESQKEIWASVQMGTEANCAYNESVSLKLSGELDLKVLQESFQQLVQRHEALRATFSSDGNRFYITDLSEIDASLIDLCQLSEPQRQQQVDEVRQQSVNKPFDLEHGPLFRVEILKIQDREHLIILSAHHIICDGWSWAVLITDLGKLYSALKGNTVELEICDRFSDYALMLEQSADEAETIATREYWLEQFSDSIPVVDFPTDRLRPSLRTFDSQREDRQLSETLVTALKRLGAKHGCSFMTTLLSGFEVFLHRITGQDDLVVGISAAGQAATGNYNLVGHCVNLLPLRTGVNSQESFKDYLQKRKKTVLDAYEHQQFTFGSLLQELSLPRDSGRIPLVPIIFNIDKGLDTNTLDFDGLEVEFFSNPRAYENFEIFINATELKGKVTLECQYNTNLFDRETICRRLAEFETLLTNIVANPDRTIATIELLPEAERQLLQQWNQTEADYPQLCIHQLVEAQAVKTPEKIAVVFEDRQITYRELNEKADCLAAYLRNLGVQPEVKVGICVERSLLMVIGLLGILKAGGAYAPIDPAYPSERIAFLLQDAQVRVLVTQASLTSELPHTAKLVCLDSDWSQIAKSPIAEAIEVKPDNLAYVIYTSGSTGKPKGVLIPHRNAVNLLNSIKQKPGLTAEDVLLAVTTISFDISVLEIFAPLIVGAQLVVISREVAADGAKLQQAIDKYEATFMQATPITWQLLAAKNSLKNKLKIISGGEALPQELAKKLLSIAGELWNFYGPTETTIWSTSCHIEKNSSITIGKPIANTKVYILDKHLQPVPIGVSGELYIGGAGVARGYLDRPELTQLKFIPNPFNTNTNRLYKTGDLAKFLPNGEIEYLGRIDDLVKVRGFRIEPGEIEAVLAQHPSIGETVVIAREDLPGDKRLVAYIVPDLKPFHRSELRSFVRERLPNYMVPSVFVFLDTMPLLPNGKVNRRALPAPDNNRQESSSIVIPQNRLESNLIQIWSRVLGVRPIGVEDNFFDLGGNSLQAVTLFAEIEKQFGKKLPLATLFQSGTVAQIAQIIRQEKWSAPWESLVPIQPNGNKPPLFYIHPTGGNVLVYRNLAYSLGLDRPVYGLQPRGLDGKHDPFTKIEDMAAYYLAQIRKLQPEGPYFLAGLSSGGNVAWEIAHLLQARGQKVALLALFDTSGSRNYKLLPPLQRLLSVCNRVMLELLHKLSNFPRKFWQKVRNVKTLDENQKINREKRQRVFNTKLALYKSGLDRISFWEKRINSLSIFLLKRFSTHYHTIVFMIALSDNQINIPNDDSEIPQALQKVQEANVIANQNYVPSAYSGKVILFKATVRPPGLYYDPKLGWGDLASGMETYEIPGNHTSIMYSSVLAEKLKICIDKAQED